MIDEHTFLDFLLGAYFLLGALVAIMFMMFFRYIERFSKIDQRKRDARLINEILEAIKKRR